MDATLPLLGHQLLGDDDSNSGQHKGRLFGSAGLAFHHGDDAAKVEPIAPWTTTGLPSSSCRTAGCLR